ncbi:MAG TPA: hypothetical protein VF286_05030 [Acidiphilium sp.]
MTGPETGRAIGVKQLRRAATIAAALGMAGTLAGCISLGGGSPPQKTYIVVPPGTQAVQVPPGTQVVPAPND